MTTFTKVSDSENPSIYTSPDYTISHIDPLIYGGFTEYVKTKVMSFLWSGTILIFLVILLAGIWAAAFMAASTTPIINTA
jgi:hypothetical protein